MENIFELATKISTPLALGGFAFAIFFLILKQLIAKGLLQQISVRASTEVIKIIIDRLFILALVAMVLGFAGYIIPKPVISEAPPYDELVENIYSYRDSIGPPPNVGVMSDGIIGLRNYPERKEHILIILRDLKQDSYLTKPVFSKQYGELLKVIEKTEDIISDN